MFGVMTGARFHPSSLMVIKQTGSHSIWPLFSLFAGIAVVCLAFGLVNYRHEEAFFRVAEHATARIERFELDRNPKVRDFCPHYVFTTQSGRTIGYQGEGCLAKPDETKVGQTEEVYFDPKVPEIVESRGWKGSEMTGLIMGSVGFVFFMLIALLNVFLMKRQARHEAH
jgi:hypothetical protein